MKYYIADMHIGHENVIRHDSRPFSSTEEMHRILVKNWNDKINCDDEVYILGDFAWKNIIGLEVLKQLVGHKFLVLGNHDKPTDEMRTYFEWVKDYALVKDNGEEVVLSHYPIAHWYNQYRGAIHLYGHVHNNKDYYSFLKYGEICKSMEIPFNCCNVGCMLDYMGYTPQSLSELKTAGALY